jgi:isocitrate/isopropylmalate dehydrogenase
MSVNIVLAFIRLMHYDQIWQTIAEGKTITGDLGGSASTKQYTEAIIAKLGR